MDSSRRIFTSLPRVTKISYFNSKHLWLQDTPKFTFQESVQGQVNRSAHSASLSSQSFHKETYISNDTLLLHNGKGLLLTLDIYTVTQTNPIMLPFHHPTFSSNYDSTLCSTASLWHRQSQQSLNTLTPFYFSFSLTTCFGPYGPCPGEIYN
jgi:hypothetical protein